VEDERAGGAEHESGQIAVLKGGVTDVAERVGEACRDATRAVDHLADEPVSTDESARAERYYEELLGRADGSERDYRKHAEERESGRGRAGLTQAEALP
jgi:hypothetical protein